MYWKAGRKDGLGTALSNRVVGHAGTVRASWVVGAQKVVPDLAPRRVEDHGVPLESARAQVAYVQSSAIAAPPCCSAITRV